MNALWNYQARVVVHADADTVAARIPTGNWYVAPRTSTTSWLDAGAHSAALLAVYLGALDLDLTIDPQRSPELHQAALDLAIRYANAAARDQDVDDSLGRP